MLGKSEGRRRRGREEEMVGWLTDSKDMSLSKLWEMGKDREHWCAAIHGVKRVRHDWATEQPHRVDILNLKHINLCLDEKFWKNI